MAKFSPDGKIVFATLIGGSEREHHTGITVDQQGDVYLVGGTHSSDFPVTRNAYDTSFNGEDEWAGDVYAAKLTPSGSGLAFSTFIGGKVEDTAHEIALDSKGNIVIAGATCSADFPATEGVIDSQFTKQDCFISTFSPDGEKLLYSTYLGGCFQFRIGPDKSGNISFVAEAGQREAFGATGFPVSEKGEEPPTYLMIGRLALGDPSAKK